VGLRFCLPTINSRNVARIAPRGSTLAATSLRNLPSLNCPERRTRSAREPAGLAPICAGIPLAAQAAAAAAPSAARVRTFVVVRIRGRLQGRTGISTKHVVSGARLPTTL
jgi:hypothetical protein